MLDQMKQDENLQTIKNDQELMKNLKNNQIILICSIFMSTLINNFMSTQEIVLNKQ